MSMFTTDVRTICESELGMDEHAGFNNVEDVLTRSAPLVFNFDFPIWDENYRLTLERKILRHYYMREIGQETVGLWKLTLCERLNLIMPYYNELYKTTVLEFNPLYDVDLTTEHHGDDKRQGTNTSREERENQRDNLRAGTNTKREESSENRSGENHATGESHDDHTGTDVNRFSDTPQGSIKDLEKDKYLTNATIDTSVTHDDNTYKRDDTNKSKGEMSSTGVGQFEENERGNEKANANKIGQEEVTTLENYIHHVIGANGNRTLVSKVVELRAAILNIDRMIIEELTDLFMGLWG